MNRQKPPGGIEWTRIDGRPGYTWNPVTGCFHGCTWRMPGGKEIECYAKTVAEGLARHAYPEGFEHHYWHPERLGEPAKVREPSGIFVGSMADLFGHWVSDDEICQVLEAMEQADWHTFQTLSKYPNRLQQFEWPENVWAGVSLPAGQFMTHTGAARALGKYLEHMRRVRARVRFLSVEPLWFDVEPVLEEHVSRYGDLPFEWVIIGAASDGRATFQPLEHWLYRLLSVLRDQDVPVFYKGNLRVAGWAEKNGTWREEFPT